MNPNNIQSSKSFFKTFKPYFSNKYTHAEKLLLVTKEKEILSDDKKIAEHFNEYFVHITDALDTMEWPTISTSIEDINDQSLKAILKYANHPNINP